MKMFINGVPCDASDGGTIEVTNPATGVVIDTIPAATKEDVAKAVACAKAAQPAWAAVPVSEKVEILYKFLDIVDDNKEKLAQTLSQETGKPIVEARAEIGNIRIGFSGFCEKAKHLYGNTFPAGLEPGQDKHVLITKKEPIGVIACVIPFNFPCDLFDQKVAPTLLAGNAAIVKPSTDNPLTLCMLTEMLGEAGVLPGAVQIVTGRGSNTGTWLCENPDVHGITLTGSTEVGIETYQRGAAHLAHIALELGGNDMFLSLLGTQSRAGQDGLVVGFAAAGGEEDLRGIGVDHRGDSGSYSDRLPHQRKGCDQGQGTDRPDRRAGW